MEDPKFRIGQIVILQSNKKCLPFKILDIIESDGEWFYKWNKKNAASEHMCRELTGKEKGE